MNAAAAAGDAPFPVAQPTHRLDVMCVCFALAGVVFLPGQAVYADKGTCSDLCGLYSDGRREAGLAMMNNFTGPDEVDAAHIMQVLGTPPVLAGGCIFRVRALVARCIVVVPNTERSTPEHVLCYWSAKFEFHTRGHENL